MHFFVSQVYTVTVGGIAHMLQWSNTPLLDMYLIVSLSLPFPHLC